MGTNHIKTVVAAMSGGVDSSVTAILLQQQGYKVIGINMRTHHWEGEVPEALRFRSCCSPNDANDARCTCESQNIPFYILDVEKEFRHFVIDNFINEYMQGRTPNPCIHCNHHLKLGYLLDKAELYGAQYVATGHYVRVEWDQARNLYLLKRGQDTQKDQSYYLFSLKQSQLARLITPLGPFTKEQVRTMAREYGLSVAEKPESQEICFIPDNNYPKFLKQTLGNQSLTGLQEGDIVDIRGKKIGTHEGYAFYTIGQRKGLGISHSTPLYVVDIIPGKNLIVVGEKKEVYSTNLIADDCNWIAFEELTDDMVCSAQIRYRHEAASCKVWPINKKQIKVIFEEPQLAITPGQAIVFFDDNIVLGGGWISTRQI